MEVFHDFLVTQPLNVMLIQLAMCCSWQRFEEDEVEASVMMVHTFNKDREKVKAAVDIISK